ncbi:MAG: hypothetical protein ACT4OF_03010 [Caulobacteraceae bacterium]
MPKRQQDPYAPPPMHHDRSGVVLRVAIMAALLGAAAWGYMTFGDQQQTAQAPDTMQDQQMADASNYASSPSTLPPPEAAPQPTAPAATPAPAPRRTAPASPPAESVPPPSTTSTPSATPAPIPPVDVPPAR